MSCDPCKISPTFVAAELDLCIYQGDTHEFFVAIESKTGDAEFAPVDLTSHTAKAQFKNTTSGLVVANFVATVEAPATEGVIKVRMETEESTKVDKDGVWDLQTVDASGDVRTWLRGKVKAVLEVTT